jgi:ATP-dependent DNA helicase RecG
MQDSIACALLFANDPLLAVPGSKIQFIRYEGLFVQTGERQNVVKQQWFEGNIPTIINNASKFLDSQVRDFYKLGKGQKFQSAPECTLAKLGLKQSSMLARTALTD